MKLYYLLLPLLFYSTFSNANYRITGGEISSPNFNGRVFSTLQEMDNFYIGKCIVTAGRTVLLNRVSNYSSTSRQYDGILQSQDCSGSIGGTRAVNVRFDSYQCPDGTFLNNSTNKCEEEKICEPDLNLGQVSWSRLVHGMRPSFCAAGCLSRPRDIVCTDDSCSATAVTIGQKCEQGQDDGIYPTDPSELDPEEPDGPPHIPDPNEPEPTDPSQPHQPTDPTKPIEGGGGVVANPSVPPVNPNPTNPLPDPTAPDNGDVVAAVVNMNRDMNKAMDNLALSVNKSSADTLQMINAGTEGVKAQIAQLENTQIQIYENEKALMLALNSDVVNAVNSVGSAVGGLGDSISSAINESIGESMGGVSDSIAGLAEGVAGIGDSLVSINEGVTGIGETLDALANFDSSGVTICGEGPCPEGFYKSQYNDGFAGVFDENFNLMKDIVTQGVVEVFGTIDLSNAAPPSFCMTLWMYGNFCFTGYINLDWIFTFIRAAFMFTTIFYARKLIIGG